MNLKDLFDKAEGGALTYDQLMAAAGTAKFVDLTEGNYVAKQKYTDDLAARDTRITTLDDTLKARDTDLANLRQQLESAGNDATKLGELNTQFANLQSKYDRDTKAYQRQLQAQAYQFAVKSFASEQAFTSAAARREFERAMTEKNLQMENDTIIGATDFLTAYKAENADSFVTTPATPPVTEPPVTKPHFVDTVQPQGNPTAGENPFLSAFNFAGVRAHPNSK